MGGRWAYLHEVLLGSFVVHAGARRIPREQAEQIVLLARGNVEYTHVLRAEGDEIADGWVVVSLDVCAKELPAWRGGWPRSGMRVNHQQQL
jgi:hypothetical protein